MIASVSPTQPRLRHCQPQAEYAAPVSQLCVQLLDPGLVLGICTVAAVAAGDRLAHRSAATPTHATSSCSIHSPLLPSHEEHKELRWTTSLHDRNSSLCSAPPQCWHLEILLSDIRPTYGVQSMTEVFNSATDSSRCPRCASAFNFSLSN